MKGLMKSAASLPRFALDCGFWRTRRYAGASPAVVGLQTAAISYCYEHGTDGWIPDDGLATSLGFKERDVAKLVPEMLRRNIWTSADDGMLIVGFLDHNPSRQQVQTERAKRATAGQKGNHDRWHAEQSQEGCQWCSQEGSQVRSESDSQEGSLTGSLEKTRREKTREDETRVGTERLPSATPDTPPPSAPGRARRLPDDFAVTDEMRAWAAQEHPRTPIDFETAKFRDHWKSKAGKDGAKLDWVATWRNWMRNASERNGNGHAPRDRVAEALAHARANPL